MAGEGGHRTALCHGSDRLNPTAPRRDLFVLVADADCQQTMRSLLAAPARLGIRPVTFGVQRHPQRDPGCRRRASEFLRPFLKRMCRAVVVFDRHGCGDSRAGAAIEESVERDLAANGWRGRSRVIVIEPELETWLWTGSPQVSAALGWGQDYVGLRSRLEAAGLWGKHLPKPDDPKRAATAAIRWAPAPRKLRRSAAWFGSLAGRMPLEQCRDPSFRRLRETLQAWFPPESE